MEWEFILTMCIPITTYDLFYQEFYISQKYILKRKFVFIVIDISRVLDGKFYFHYRSETMSKLMKRSRTVDTSAAPSPPTSGRPSTDESAILSSPHRSRPIVSVTESPNNSNRQSSSKKQRWSFAFRKRLFSSSSSRSSKAHSQSEDLESPTNISGMALSFPAKTSLGPPSSPLSTLGIMNQQFKKYLKS